MGLFDRDPARREARLERRRGRIDSKLEEVKRQIPAGVAAAQLAPKFDNPQKGTSTALAELKDYVIMLDAKQQQQIDALDNDIGEVNRNAKMGKKGAGGAFGGGDGMSPLLLVLLLGGGLGGTTSTTSGNSNLLLILLLAGGLGGDDGGMGGGMGLILLLALL